MTAPAKPGADGAAWAPFLHNALIAEYREEARRLRTSAKHSQARAFIDACLEEASAMEDRAAALFFARATEAAS